MRWHRSDTRVLALTFLVVLGAGCGRPTAPSGGAKEARQEKPPSPLAVREGKPVLLVPGELRFPGNAWIKRAPEGNYFENDVFVFIPKGAPDQQYRITPKGARALKWGYFDMKQDGNLILSADNKVNVDLKEGQPLCPDQSYTVTNGKNQVVFEWPAR